MNRAPVIRSASEQDIYDAEPGQHSMNYGICQPTWASPVFPSATRSPYDPLERIRPLEPGADGWVCRGRAKPGDRAK